jgi:hypothetical protein
MGREVVSGTGARLTARRLASDEMTASEIGLRIEIAAEVSQLVPRIKGDYSTVR